MKKIILISFLFGPVLVIIQRIFEVIKIYNVLGLNGIYQCAITINKPCSFYSYVFHSDMSSLTYAAIILSFIILLIVVSYTFYLYKLYKNNNYKLFWILVGITILLVGVSPFVINYFQFIY